MRSIAVALLVLVMSAACAARPVPVVATFVELPSRVNQGDALSVTDIDGAITRGRIVVMTPERLVLRLRSPSGQDVELPRERVRQVGVVGDPIGNGVRAGFVAGAAIGLVGRYTVWSDTGTAPWTHAVLLGAVGAGLGAVTDALVRREVVVFRATPATASLVVGPTAERIDIVWRW